MGIPKRTKTAIQQPRTREGMHVCESCSSVLVQPVKWFEEGDGNWHVQLRCPECEWRGHGTFAQPVVDRFDEELDRGGHELIESLRALTRANMADEADRFAEALASNTILPEDF
jgi:hypothetical protein